MTLLSGGATLISIHSRSFASFVGTLFIAAPYSMLAFEKMRRRACPTGQPAS